jgi:hypothetical protein
MIRTQMQLRQDQVRALKRRAAERGVSMAELIRDAIDLALDREDEDAKWERALSVVGKFASGGGDIAERHDEYLGQMERW